MQDVPHFDHAVCWAGGHHVGNVRAEMHVWASTLVGLEGEDGSLYFTSVIAVDHSTFGWDCKVVLLSWMPSCRLDILSEFRDLGLDFRALVADVQNVNSRIISCSKKCVVGDEIPPYSLNFVLMQVRERGLALEVIEIPNSDGTVLRAWRQVLLLMWIQWEAHNSIGVSAEIFVFFVLANHWSWLLFLTLFQGTENSCRFNSLGIKVPYFNLGQESTDNNVIRLFPLPMSEPFQTQGIRTQ